MKQAVAVVVAALLVTVGAIALLADRGGDGGGATSPGDQPNVFETTTTLTDEERTAREAADTYQTGVEAALAPLGDVAGRYVTDVQSWKDGLVDDATLRTSLAGWKTDITAVRINVEALEPFEPAPAAHPSFVALAAFYDAAIDASTAALDIPPGELRDQTARLAQRLRTLGDRSFERANAALAAAASRDPDPNVAVVDPVPDWAAEDLAAGPPLEANPPAPASLDEAEGTTQPRDDWLAAVAGAGAPTATEVLDVLRDGSADDLAAVARRLEDAAAQLRTLPDPEGEDGREESARVRLGFLALAEVARLGQVATFVEAPDLAERLRFTGSSLHAIVSVPAFSPAP